MTATYQTTFITFLEGNGSECKQGKWGDYNQYVYYNEN